MSKRNELCGCECCAGMVPHDEPDDALVEIDIVRVPKKEFLEHIYKLTEELSRGRLAAYRCSIPA